MKPRLPLWWWEFDQSKFIVRSHLWASIMTNSGKKKEIKKKTAQSQYNRSKSHVTASSLYKKKWESLETGARHVEQCCWCWMRLISWRDPHRLACLFSSSLCWSKPQHMQSITLLMETPETGAHGFVTTWEDNKKLAVSLYVEVMLYIIHLCIHHALYHYTGMDSRSWNSGREISCSVIGRIKKKREQNKCPPVNIKVYWRDGVHFVLVC